VTTGFPESDAGADFARERRRESRAKLVSRLSRERQAASALLAFDDVVGALGRVAEHDLGLQAISLESIVGSVERRGGEFDRRFRPRSRRPQTRWQRIAAARRRGEAMAPIDVYRVGELHFVKDGHHRVSVARAHGDQTIDAHVREVHTALPATAQLRPGDLWLTRHEREFHRRVPLPPAARARIDLAHGGCYQRLGAHVEAWAFQAGHAEGRLLTREQAALAWFEQEYEPITEFLQDSGFGGPGGETARYLRVIELRDLLIPDRGWNQDISQRLLAATAKTAEHPDDDRVRHLLKEIRVRRSGSGVRGGRARGDYRPGDRRDVLHRDVHGRSASGDAFTGLPATRRGQRGLGLPGAPQP
jgi:hypothetical protein